MAPEKKARPKYRVVYRRASTALKCIVLAAILLCTFCLMFLRGRILKEEAAAEALRTQAAGLQQDNEMLQQELDQLGTVESVKRIAMELLDLVAPDTVLVQADESNPE